MDDYDIADFYNRTAHRREDMIQYCTWKGHPCADESWVVSYTHYSKCYTFNSKGDHTLLKAGAGEFLLNCKLLAKGHAFFARNIVYLYHEKFRDSEST